jgi:hypothetical protein
LIYVPKAAKQAQGRVEEAADDSFRWLGALILLHTTLQQIISIRVY